MDYDDTPEDPTEDIFPTPPKHPHEIELLLRSQTRISTHFRSSQGTNNEFKVGGMGEEDKTGGTAGVEVVVSKREWIPSAEDKDKGSWKQETNMRLTLYLKCLLMFSSPTMSIDVSSAPQLSFRSLSIDQS